MAWERSFHRHHPAVSVDVPRSHRASVLFGRRDPCAIRVRVPARSSARCAGGRNETGSKRRVHNFRRRGGPAWATAGDSVHGGAGREQHCWQLGHREPVVPSVPPPRRDRTNATATRANRVRGQAPEFGALRRRRNPAGRRCWTTMPTT
jgi:hypothetical protein